MRVVLGFRHAWLQPRLCFCATVDTNMLACIYIRTGVSLQDPSELMKYVAPLLCCCCQWRISSTAWFCMLLGSTHHGFWCGFCYYYGSTMITVYSIQVLQSYWLHWGTHFGGALLCKIQTHTAGAVYTKRIIATCSVHRAGKACHIRYYCMYRRNTSLPCKSSVVAMSAPPAALTSLVSP